MPYPRPVSPHSLETCASPPSDNDADDLIASDDELDDVSRAAKRQRIEKLAKSYLQGKPLFIHSASLRGPLDEGWANPWKKNRTHGSGRATPLDHEAQVSERIVQETDSRAPRYKEGLPAATHRPEVPVSSFSSLNRTSVPPGNHSSPSRSPRRKSKQSTPRPGHDGNVSRSPVKSSGLPSSSTESRTKGPLHTSNWLKKDRTLLNFKKYDPPSSPTRSIVSRHSDKTRRPPPRSVQVQVPQTPGFHPTQTVPVNTTQSVHVKTNGHPSPQSTHSTHSVSSIPPEVSKAPKLSPLLQAKFPPGASLQIVNSFSQLPRFEYRRWPPQQSKSPLQDESILQEETFLHDDNPSPEQIPAASLHASITRDRPLNPHVATVPEQLPVDPLSINPTDNRELDPAAPNNAEKIEVPKQKPPNGNEDHKPLSKDLRFADKEDIVIEQDDGATSVCKSPSALSEQITTEHNTYEDLPSAQQVPAPLGISDRVTSLHSTALPKGGSEIASNTSPDTQLSTQAALLHAQKSFQDDLGSPAYYAPTPGQNRAVHSPGGANFSANVTPFYRFEDSLRRDIGRNTLSESEDKAKAMSTQFMLDAATPFNFSTEQTGQDRSSKPTNKNLTQAMNTQFMLDAATPFAFSTEKKQRVPRPESPTSPSPESERRKTHSVSRSASPGSESTGMEYEYRSAQPTPAGRGNNIQSGAQQPDPPSNYPSTTDAFLPLSLGESTPTTGQDGQGAHQAVESFNLSQAIADAGSFLQQSFVFVKDSGRPSQSLQSLL
jgi:hypothetical protein